MTAPPYGWIGAQLKTGVAGLVAGMIALANPSVAAEVAAQSPWGP